MFLTGHLTLYAYLTPFLKDVMHVEANWISVFYFIFGIAAVIGGGFGGWLADKWGSKKSIISIIIGMCNLHVAINDILIPALHHYDGTLEYAELGDFTSTAKLFN